MIPAPTKQLTAKERQKRLAKLDTNIGELHSRLRRLHQCKATEEEMNWLRKKANAAIAEYQATR